MRVKFLLFFFIFSVSLKAQDSLFISKENAIEIAKKHGYYKTDNGWRVQVVYDSRKQHWRIQTRKDGSTFFHRNVIGHIKNITIDAKTGKVINKTSGWPSTPPRFA
jgi:hypothetical protein